MSTQVTALKRQQSRYLNQAIDRALGELSEESLREVLSLCATQNAIAVAERIRRRAALLSRAGLFRSEAIRSARDRLMLVVYASAAPRGWFSAWCDGSSFSKPGWCCAGSGGLLVNPRGTVIEQITRFAGNLAPFEAEIAALAGVLRIALERGVERIRVHTDCKALVRLWRQNPEDRRLASARALANKLRRVVVRLVPRQRNQVANRLARSAALAGERCRSEPPG